MFTSVKTLLTISCVAIMGFSAQAQDQWLSRSSPAIGARHTHTAVWTGDSMIVWGGYNGSINLNSGSVFQPNNNTWTTITSVNAPSARSQHSSVWSGTEMIIWGGANAGYFNTGGRYNPKSNSWLATSTVNAPSARSFHAAFWTGSEMLVWGGSLPSGLNDGALYNPTTDSWRTMSGVNAPSVRVDPKFVWTGTEFIVWGGNFNNTELIDGAAYNPITDTWRPIASPTGFAGRGFIRALWTGEEMIVWGGGDVNTPSSFLNSGARYNPGNDSWTIMTTVNAPQARGHHESVWTGSEMIIFGGAGNGFVNLNTGARYNPATDSWSAITTTSAPLARRHYTAAWTGATLLIYGGLGGSILNNTDSWSPNDFSDGIPNSWRVNYFGNDYRHIPGALISADPDKDGSNNLVEYLAETSPVDAGEGFASALVMTPAIKWYSIPGRTYRILRKQNLNDPEWTLLSSDYLAAGEISVYYDDEAPSTKSFYLVEIVPL